MNASHSMEEQLKKVLDRVFHHLIGMGASKEDAEDVIQDTAVKFFRSLDGIDDRNVDGWLFRVAVNGYFDLCRRRRTLQAIHLKFQVDELWEGHTPEEALLRGETGTLVVDVLSTLKPKHRQLLILKYSADLSIREIAALSGMKEGSVKTTLYRARKAFVDTYRRSGHDEAGL